MAQQLDKNYQETMACDGNIQIKIELNVPGTHISGPFLSWPCEGHWFLHVPPASTLQNSASCPPKVLKVLVCFESFIFLGRNTAHVGNHLAVFQDSLHYDTAEASNLVFVCFVTILSTNSNHFSKQQYWSISLIIMKIVECEGKIYISNVILMNTKLQT